MINFPFGTNGKSTILGVPILKHIAVQSTLIILTSIISNNHLSRRENLVLVLTQKSKNRVTKYCGKEEKLLLGSNFSPFSQYFQYIFLTKEVKLHNHL